MQIKKTFILRQFINTMNEIKSHRSKVELVMEKFKIAQNPNTSVDEKLATLEEATEISKAATSEYKLLGSKLDKIGFWINLTTLIIIVLVIITGVSGSSRYENINIEYYISVVGLIPLLLLSIYFSETNIFSSDSFISSINELMSKILPSIAGAAASLFAIAQSKSSYLIFMITLYSLIVLTTSLVVKIVGPGIIKNFLKNRRLTTAKPVH